MRPFLSMAANRAVDEYAINICGIPGQTLMKNAGEQTIRQIEASGLLPDSGEVLVLAGKGNNGGDGYVIAHELVKRGVPVALISLAEEQDMMGDALFHYQGLKASGLHLELWENTLKQQKQISKAALLVDALLGTGVKGKMRTPYAEIIELCNLSEAPIVSVDLPSGLTGDQGDILNPCIQAKLSVSMGFGKQGCLFEPARSKCGKIQIVDIGFPEDSLAPIKDQILVELEASDFPADKFTRPADAHKYSSGKVFLIAGSRGFSGAALLASTAALRAGAGLVRLALPESLVNIAETLSRETVVEGVPESMEESFSTEAYSALMAGSEWADVVAIGPGIGRYEETIELTRELIQNIERPLIIDADALYALSEDVSILAERKQATLLTPHMGEFKRLLKHPEGEANPTWKEALEFCNTYHVYLLLKGAPSLMVSPKGMVFVNSTGYAGMATAGSGDVLTGTVAALWSQWDLTPKVLNFAMYTHGLAADLNREEKGVLGLIAGDIIEKLPTALRGYGEVPA